MLRILKNFIYIFLSFLFPLILSAKYKQKLTDGSPVNYLSCIVILDPLNQLKNSVFVYFLGLILKNGEVHFQNFQELWDLIDVS